MVAQLAIEDDLRRDLRDRLLEAIKQFQPDVVAAHSLGSLVTYDFLRNDPRSAGLLAGATYITFGSQINNPFARSRLFPGQINVPKVRFWYHLYNPQDPVLTAPIQISSPQFCQVNANSASGHAATATAKGPGYLDHSNTRGLIWSALAEPAGAGKFSRNFKLVSLATRKPQRRALLIGINEYPDPANRLDGCVNDVFLISSLLQERGFEAEDIRVVLNERATAQGIRERLAWLLEGAEDDMERVFFYSGHGAQMPGYNALERVDHVDECLVPYDFAWTKSTAITDDDFYQLYSDLPYNTHFFAMLDCCHAGGMTRDGGHKVRGITPPDDIRHRMLEWDCEEKMWRERKLPPFNAAFGGSIGQQRQYMGDNLATFRLGRAMRLRKLNHGEYSRLPRTENGPYLPVLIEACGEEQLSYEYRHGVTSYGAFTYSLAKNLRSQPRSSFKQLVQRTSKTLHALKYDQTPQLVGPSPVLTKVIPGEIRT